MNTSLYNQDEEGAEIARHSVKLQELARPVLLISRGCGRQPEFVAVAIRGNLRLALVISNVQSCENYMPTRQENTGIPWFFDLTATRQSDSLGP